MSDTAAKPLTGTKVAIMFCAGFAVIIAVNLLLAFQAVATFPGLETKNSYVASQSFEVDRTAQEALNWDVNAHVQGDVLTLQILKDGVAVVPEIKSAVFGRATHTAQDQFPELRHDGTAFKAPVSAADGNWNLRLVATAEDGTLFRQRIIVSVEK